jgi:prepilin-type N-terminal cleavage/methylation domain-containing protein
MPRRGFTLIELLIVVAIIGMSAGLAGVALRETPPATGAERRATRVADARRSAMRRAGTMHLTDTTRSGAPHDVQVDALGTCRPAAPAPADDSLAFDAVRCVWREASRP